MAITTLLCGTCTSMQKLLELCTQEVLLSWRGSPSGFRVQGALHSLSRPNDTSAMIPSQVVDSRQRQTDRQAGVVGF